MTALTHPIFGDVEVAFLIDSKLAGKACTLDDINRQDVVLTKIVGAWEITAKAGYWLALELKAMPPRRVKNSPERPPSSPLTNLQAALEAIKES